MLEMKLFVICLDWVIQVSTYSLAGKRKQLFDRSGMQLDRFGNVVEHLIERMHRFFVQQHSNKLPRFGSVANHYDQLRFDNAQQFAVADIG